MSIPATLHAICDLLERETGLAAQTGVPGRSAKGLFVWPYRMVLTEARTTLSHASGEPPPIPLDIFLLVLARPAFSETGLDGLDAALHAVIENPVIALADGQVRLTLDSRLGAADLAALFAAARLQPCLALELVARTTIARAASVP